MPSSRRRTQQGTLGWRDLHLATRAGQSVVSLGWCSQSHPFAPSTFDDIHPTLPEPMPPCQAFGACSGLTKRRRDCLFQHEPLGCMSEPFQGSLGSGNRSPVSQTFPGSPSPEVEPRANERSPAGTELGGKYSRYTGDVAHPAQCLKGTSSLSALDFSPVRCQKVTQAGTISGALPNSTRTAGARFSSTALMATMIEERHQQRRPFRPQHNPDRRKERSGGDGNRKHVVDGRPAEDSASSCAPFA